MEEILQYEHFSCSYYLRICCIASGFLLLFVNYCISGCTRTLYSHCVWICLQWLLIHTPISHKNINPTPRYYISPRHAVERVSCGSWYQDIDNWSFRVACGPTDDLGILEIRSKHRVLCHVPQAIPDWLLWSGGARYATHDHCYWLIDSVVLML